MSWQPRTSSSEPGDAAQPGRRLSPGALLERAVQGARDDEHTALLVVRLNRSDRLAALAQHPESRQTLLEIARRVEAMMRARDHWAVASHDELWVLLVDLPTTALAELAGRTLRESLARPVHADDRSTPIAQLQPVVGGCWTLTSDRDAPVELLRAATAACALAAAEDDQVLISAPQTRMRTIDRNRLENELRVALYANELDVFFQPQVDLRTRRCTNAEALVRWTREDGSTVPPDLLVSICEERGLMNQLTQFVLNTALRHLMTWSGQGLELGVSINLSNTTLADSTYPALVAHTLDTWSVDPTRLTLELTESAIVRNERSAIEFMHRIRDQGCKLALDDFGTGYSSFAYLRKLPIGELKIDQSFVRNMIADRNDGRIVQVLIDLAHTFDMMALAEGVEDAAIAARLAEAGCDVAQGYHYARPLPPFEFAGWVRAFNAGAADQDGTARAVPDR
ncbi:MAG TPA: EAL domain-containing protein [Quisquiliibacterium sp.]|nr:EAL domain-containing protein [Quisquiliibacterium sp.]HQN12956.1 EAL domain-containing protein [Quisquiliibacterium sp.]HQP66076.1 EAL domain-containing protein [Quisquiliibacterium sp.]